MKILVTGRQGQLAKSLQIASGENDDIEMFCLGRPDIDLNTGAGIREAIDDNAIDIVINAGAYTNVDKAQSEEETAFAINATGAGRVAEYAAAANCPIIHISTDYVFDGLSDKPYREEDRVNPVNTYGRSKLEGERLVAEFNPRNVIVRTAWVVSPFASNFVRTMLRLGTERQSISVVDDQVGCPTGAPDLAQALLKICHRINTSQAPDLTGIFNLTNAGATTWFGVAEQVFAKSATLGGPVAEVVPINSEEYPTPAPRPGYSLLSPDKINQVYDIKMRDWRIAIDACVAQIVGTERA